MRLPRQASTGSSRDSRMAYPEYVLKMNVERIAQVVREKNGA